MYARPSRRTVFPSCVRCLAVACAFSLVAAQTQAQTQAQMQTQMQVHTGMPTPAPAGDTITVPAGTSIPATLSADIHTKKSKVGQSIRATVDFPVTVSDRLAIPAGTSVEGVLDAAPPTKKNKHPLPTLHFTRLVFADGSTAALDGSPQSAQLRRIPLLPQTPPQNLSPQAADPAFAMTSAQQTPRPAAGAFAFLRRGGGSSFAAEAQAPRLLPASFAPALPQTAQQPESNPFAHGGPNPFVIIGPVLAVVGGVLLLAFHLSKSDTVRYASGYQFQLVLNAPVTLDAAHVAASAAMPAK